MKEFDIEKRIIGFFRKDEVGFISGEDISGALGVSRACVWKYIKKLRESGYVIEAVPHLGYRLKSVPDRLYGYEISEGLETETIGRKSVYYYENIGSTNDRAYELAESGQPEGTLVIAETQTHGKGRIGRKWVSPKTGGIYMSLILRPDVETDEVPTITLVAAAAFIRAIKKTCELETRIKWPNDILVGGKKLCGILTELKAQPDRVDFLVLGIGINVNTPAKKLPPEGTSLKIELSRHVSRAELIRCMLEEFEKDYVRFKKEGFASLREECKELSLVLGRHVKVTEHHRSIEGLATDIDEKGALIIRTDTGRLQRVFSGDVVLCR
ncbi:MAG: biotin--[acetyl-CoA-carboxylase] ligase [Candidatus Omnitrophota bacterium]